ncbi:hypothetical protein C8Q74DRAFT_1296377 [Fomes fomentarius]|nr:hypothetical protein C8Q74DRAFT_1296377 [Fomes fomentarius]
MPPSELLAWYLSTSFSLAIFLIERCSSTSVSSSTAPPKHRWTTSGPSTTPLSTTQSDASSKRHGLSPSRVFPQRTQMS